MGSRVIILISALSVFSLPSQLNGQGQLLISMEQGTVEALNLAIKEEKGGEGSRSSVISMEPKPCAKAMDCVMEHCCSDMTSCCLPIGRCGCQDPDTKICGNGPIALMANHGMVENDRWDADQVGAVSCVQKGKVKGKKVAVSLNMLHPNLLLNGEIQQQVGEDYIFHTKFYGRLNGEEIIKSLLSQLNGKEIVEQLDEEQVEETVFQAIQKKAEAFFATFSGKEILELLSDLQLEQLFEEVRRRRDDLS